jgi:hypothetical protein
MLETASAKIDRFGWSQMSGPLKDELTKDWCDVLSQYTLQEVRDGIRSLFAAHKGKLRSINEYQVQEQICLAHRKLLETLPQKTPEPEPERDFSPEAVARRQALSAELLGKSGKSVTMPPAQSEAQTQANINAAKDEVEAHGG